MDEKDLDVIIALAELNSITRTAERLYMTQPAVTHRVRSIEERLGEKILIRTQKGVCLTPVGEALISHVQQAKVSLQNIRDYAAALSGKVGGTLRLGVSIAYAHYRLPVILRDYVRAFPNVHVNIRTDRSSKLFSILQREEISLAIVRGEFKWQETKALLSSEHYYISYHKEIGEKDLRHIPYIDYRSDVLSQADVRSWLQDKVCSLENGTIWADSIDTTKELVRQGLGWALLPEICLGDFSGFCIPVSFGEAGYFQRRTYAFCHEKHLELPQVREFLELIKSRHAAGETPVVSASSRRK